MKNCNNCNGFVPKSKQAQYNAFDYIVNNRIGCCVNVENVEGLYYEKENCELWEEEQLKNDNTIK